MTHGFFPLALVLLLAGCSGSQSGGIDGGDDGSDGDAGGLCTASDECPTGEECIDGVCRTEGWCDDTADCPEGSLCNVISHECIEADCLVDEDCGEQHWCDEGTCRELCELVECALGFRCNPEDGQCERLTCTVGSVPCELDEDCPDGYSCDPISAGCTECPSGFFCNFHECFAMQLDCQAHSDCETGERCNPDTNRCEGFPDACTSDKDCDPKFCNLYTHQCQDEPFTGSCATDDECRQAYGSQYICHPRLYTCVLPLDPGQCYDTEDCKDAALVCDPRKNECVEAGSICLNDTDCTGLNEICYNYTCIYACENSCIEDAECAANQVCHNSCCLDSCSADYDCDAGEQCVSGICQAAITCADRFEPNDNAGSPTHLGTATPGVPISQPNLVSCSNNDDWYTVDVPANNEIVVDIHFSDSQGDIDLYMYTNPAGSSVDSSAGVSDNEQVSDFASANTTYFIKVHMYSSNAVNPYDLLVSVQPWVDPCASDDQYEPNNSSGAAATLPLPAEGTSNVYSLKRCGDDDWFKVQVPAGAYLKARIDFNNAAGDLDLYLYANSGSNEVDYSNYYSYDYDEVEHQATTATTYYIKVTDYSDDNDYTLTIQHLASLCSAEDGLEPNDSQGAPRLLDVPNPGPDVYNNLFVCMANEDWYGFNMTAGDGLKVELDFTHANGDIEMKMYSPAGSLVDSSTSPGNYERVEVAQATSTGTYLVRVYHDSVDDDAGNPYTMTVSHYPGGVDSHCVDDLLEDNDVYTAASALGLSVANQVICGPDQDWFAVDLQADERIEVVADYNRVSGAPLSLQLYAADGVTLLDEQHGAVNSTSLRVAASSQTMTTFFVKVYMAAPRLGDRDTYQLVVARSTADCSDDGFEPNNEAGFAALVTAGDYAGAFLCVSDPADEDWYRVSLNAGEGLQAAADFNSADGNLIMELYEADGETLIAEGDYGQNHREVSSGRLWSGGDLLLRVFHSGILGGPLAYRLNIVVDPPLSCTDDGAEPNDDAASATTLTGAGSGPMSLCPGNEDWFVIDLAWADISSFSLVNDGGVGDADLYLYDVALQEVDRSTTSGTGTEQIEFLALSAGTFYLKVVPRSQTSEARTDYHLDVVIDSVPDCTDDGAEPNNQLVSATSLAGAGSGDMVLCPADNDYFVIDALLGDDLVFTLNNNSGLGDVDLYLLNPAGEVLQSSVRTGIQDDYIHRFCLADETLFLRVVHKNALARDAVDYVLDVLLDSLPTCSDDAAEPDDDLAQAVAVDASGSGPRVLCPMNEDFFLFDGQRGDRMTFTLVNDSGAGDLDLFLLDDNGDEIDSSESSGASSDAVEMDFVYDRVVYLQVKQKQFIDRDIVDYHLEVFQATFSPCDDDAYDPNESSAQATLLTDMPFLPDGGDHVLFLDELEVCKASSTVAYDDWFALDLDAGMQLSVSMAYTVTTNEDLDLELYHPDGTTKLDSSYYSNPEVVDFGSGVPVDGTYYLRVFSYRINNTVPYDLTVTSDTAFICDQQPYDAFEPNGNPAEADANAVLGAGTEIVTLCGAEDDFYAIDVLAGQTVRVTTTFPISMDMDLYLFAADGSTLLDASEGLTETEQVEYTVAGAGRVYVQTYFNKHNPAFQAQYDIQVELIDP